ncbi:GNAT family N-acetyltransferase [Ktedonospora formicarum]|uniref:N-acetyltransferase domain-containing protein n=1 Tax=Ktedonospora formicarum TaxID=2778364 RepID=A0A8J3MVK6_9CHLR|nr:GNAT family N-acetyltransferase [Ktedonospora formicarum]GHO46610.1 hypothetical protein KSX_47730 [Ktedonospora formicarum]
MSEYLFTDFTGYTLAQLCEMHNSSFSGYFVPNQATPQVFADFWRIYQVDACSSVNMHDQEGAFVGQVRLARRGKRGWCGGFGVAPAFRGRGLSGLLAKRMLETAREAGLETLQLEVLTQNTPAIKAYEKAGFTTRRRLLGLEVALEKLPEAPVLHVERVPLETLLPWLGQNDVTQSWQRELATLFVQEVETFVAPGPGGGMNGLVIQRGGGKARIQAAVVQSALTDSELLGLLREVAGDCSGIQIYNEPEDSPLLKRYLRLGFTEFFTQHEMFIRL